MHLHLERYGNNKITQNNTEGGSAEFPHSFATALFSFLYHLSSFEQGGISLVHSGMMVPLLSVVTNMGDQQEQTTVSLMFVGRYVFSLLYI